MQPTERGHPARCFCTRANARQFSFCTKRRGAPSRTEKRRSAFTLLELLIVIAIISVIATLTVMSLSSPGGAAQLTTAGNETVDVLNNARQYAQAQNTLAMVAVINTGADAGRVLGSFAFSATNGTDGTWSQIDRWRILPDKAEIDLTASTNALGSPMASALPLRRGGTTVNCVATTFLPDGRPMAPSSSQPSVIQLRNRQGPTNNYYKIIINQATGTPIVRRPQ
ncbi:MAG: prepilin-type N-terminal cleavage/methylation domain-containing protein [Chthoniobacterales bacterium]|nr:prepilin-type N-terminal cleavage/methylation domain-containing protein [Chthoniobacterales bacterium]